MRQRVGGLGKFSGVALFFVAAFLLASSFFVPGEYSRLNLLGPAALYVLGILSDILLLVTVYLTSEPVLPRTKDRSIAVMMSAALIFACPGTCVFSVIHPAAVALLWAQFCLLEEQYFTAFFLMALSSLFFPPVLWIAHLVIILMLIARLPDPLRNLLKFAGGILIPYMLFYGVLYIAEGPEKCLKAAAEAGAVMSGIFYDFYSISLPTLFLIASILLMLAHAIILFLSRMKEYGIAESYALKMQIINVVVCVAEIMLFTSHFSLPVALLGCCPCAILLARYFQQYGQGPIQRIEIVILLCALVISRLGYLIV